MSYEHPPAGQADALDDESPLWLVNEQIKGLLEGEGASEDHEDVLAFLRSTGLPEGTVARMHQALVWGDTKTRTNQPPVSVQLLEALTDAAIEATRAAITAAEAQQAEPVRLTDDEIKTVWLGRTQGGGTLCDIARAIETASFRKNGLLPPTQWRLK